MPKHSHSGSATTTTLTGSASLATGEFTSSSGIVSLSGYTIRRATSTSNNSYSTQTINATHQHNLSIDSSGLSKAFNNFQPYISVYCWKRVS